MRAEILIGPERRRRWSAEEKARVVAEAAVPGARIAEIARRYGVSRGLIYAWRGEAGQGLSGDGRGAALPDLVPVVVRDAGDEAGPPVPVRKKRRSCPPAATNPDGVIEIVLPGDVRMTVRGRVEGRTLRAVLGALRSA
jgi:transposase